VPLCEMLFDSRHYIHYEVQLLFKTIGCNCTYWYVHCRHSKLKQLHGEVKSLDSSPNMYQQHEVIVRLDLNTYFGSVVQLRD